MLAFRKAIYTGCEGIELDVQFSKDGKIVIIHDEDVSRTTNGSGSVCDMSCAQLRELDAGRGERIPLLSEYFDMVEDLPIVTNIELKNNLIPYKGLEEMVLEMVRARVLSDRVIISSFNHESVDKVKNLAPDILCGYICWGKLDGEGLAARMCETGVEFVHPALSSLDSEFMESVRVNSLRISVWTVNDAESMRQLTELDVYGIFTDDPKNIRRHL